MKSISKLDKINETHENLKSFYKYNNEETRDLIEEKYSKVLGNSFKVICNETNNDPYTISLGWIIITIYFEENSNPDIIDLWIYPNVIIGQCLQEDIKPLADIKIV